MANKPCLQRLQKEYRALCKEPVPQVTARPSPGDLLDWHFVLEGATSSPYEGGIYHGRLRFSNEYPFKPPAIVMSTPNGRFAPGRRICMSYSDFHPESWNPMWSVSSILTGLLSFMMDTAPTTGSVSTTAAEKKRLARESLAFNCRSSTFQKIFPEYVERYEASLRSEEAAALSSELSPANTEGGESLAVPGSSERDINVEGMGGGRRRKKKAAFQLPLWLTALLVALCGMTMALPLLSLHLRS